MGVKNKFETIRLERGFKTAKAFAAYLKINYDQYIKYENNLRQPTPEILIKVHRVLEMHIEDMIYLEEEDKL